MKLSTTLTRSTCVAQRAQATLPPQGLPAWATELLRRAEQSAAKARSTGVRNQNLKHDWQFSHLLALSGSGE